MWLQKALVFIKKNWFILFAVATYVFFTFYYMGPGIYNCGDTVNGFGDSTAGPIWRNSIDNSAPLIGSEKYTNYPIGESLMSPVEAAVIGQTSAVWLASILAGPVCGYNSVNAIGFLSTSLMMFGFIYTLTRNRWVALLAGYAVAFTPYIQVKVGVHIAYGYVAILIGAIWALLSLIQTQKVSRALILSGVVALSFYFDPYFSLLVTTLLAPFVLVYVLTRALNWKKLEASSRRAVVRQLKLMGLSLGIIAALISPLFTIMVTQHEKIDASLAGTRDNIGVVAKLCSNWPQEYVLPFPDSPLFRIFGSYQGTIKSGIYNFSTCGIAEDSVGIALAILLIIGIGLVVFMWEKLNKRSLGLAKFVRYDPNIIIIGSLVTGTVAFLIAFPPFTIFGIPSPSQLLISITSTWRIIAREYIVINLVSVILFSVFLAYFARKLMLPRVIKVAFLIVIFILIFIQYQTYRPLEGNVPTKFSYSEAPKAYTWLSSQDKIHAVAEYPIEKVTESNSLGYYLTMQTIHRKPLLNSALVDSPQNQVRSSIKNLSDPQTIRVLGSLGIDAVIIHGADVDEIKRIPYLSIVYAGSHQPSRKPESENIKRDSLIIARIIDVPPLYLSFQFQENLPYNSAIQESPAQWQYEVPNGTKFVVSGILRAKPETDVKLQNVCMRVRMSAKGDTGIMRISSTSGNKIYFTGNISSEYMDIDIPVTVNESMTISNDKGYNMRITKIGCMG